jgi:hypothetical protein
VCRRVSRYAPIASQHQDVEQLGAGAGPSASRCSRSRRSSSSGLMTAGYATPVASSSAINGTLGGGRASLLA